MDESSDLSNDDIVDNDINDWLSQENVMENIKVYIFTNLHSRTMHLKYSIPYLLLNQKIL